MSEFADIRARLENPRLAPYPWTQRIDELRPDYRMIIAAPEHPIDIASVVPWMGWQGEANADFIAHAPTDIRALLAAYDTERTRRHDAYEEAVKLQAELDAAQKRIEALLRGSQTSARQIEEQRKRIEALEDALTFYADEGTYLYDEAGDFLGEPKRIMVDEGERARRALDAPPAQSAP